ncbi:MAG: hypothetical protein KTR30_00100 [Saprospiraceae bacterium]|nr:hypothetical protein [Saprospiraceae bacterium]
MKKLVLAFALLMSFSVFQSCQKDSIENPEEQVAPTLPPAESFIMPFTGYEDIDTTGLINNGGLDERGGPNSFRNWFYAGSNIVVWNVILGVNMAIPVASFLEAFNHDAVYDGQGAFIWAYDFTLGNDTFLAELSARLINNNQEVEWVMNISKVGGFTNVEWYRGVTSRDNSRASWTLNHRPNNPEPLIDILHEKDIATNQISTRYTNLIPNNENNGDYIEYKTSINSDFNRAYDVFRANTNELLEIEWNAPSGEGRVRNSDFFNDKDWHCWDQDLRDTSCQ